MDNLQKLKEMTDFNQVSPFYERLDALMKELDPNGVSWEQVAAMYNLHNEMFPQIKEFSTFCDKCRSRVYNRLCNWLEKQEVILAKLKEDEELLLAKLKEDEEAAEASIQASIQAANAKLDSVVQDTQEPPKPKRGRKKKATGDSQPGVSPE
jgi:DNA-binding protein H-NS